MTLIIFGIMCVPEVVFI